jgi:hypothetical protein
MRRSFLILGCVVLLTAWPAGTSQAQTGSTTVPAFKRPVQGMSESTTVPRPP